MENICGGRLKKETKSIELSRKVASQKKSVLRGIIYTQKKENYQTNL